MPNLGHSYFAPQSLPSLQSFCGQLMGGKGEGTSVGSVPVGAEGISDLALPTFHFTARR